MKTRYLFNDAKLTSRSVAMLNQINEIVEDYAAQGYSLTLRQVYYQLVAKAEIENNQKSYNRLQTLVSKGRLLGLIDWEAIVDRTRSLRTPSHWTSPQDIVNSAALSFALDKWIGQDYLPFVLVEKDALIGIVEPLAQELDVPCASMRGYSSQSMMWRLAMQLQVEKRKYKRDPVILYLGDHDPSGIDMSRDVEDRMNMFMGGCEVKRLALNMDQIEVYNPPPNYVKADDSRTGGYRETFQTDECWELDALEPRVLTTLIREAVLALRNDRKWRGQVAAEKRHRRHLTLAAIHWDEITTHMEEQNFEGDNDDQEDEG